MRSVSPFAAGSPAYALGEEVQRKFIEWRRSKPLGIRRIPDELWNAATRLAAATTANRVSRLLGLDYSQLKRRVTLICGPKCPALPGHLKGKSSRLRASPPPTDSQEMESPERTTPSIGKRPLPGIHPSNIGAGSFHHPVSTFAVTASYIPRDGFIEATAVAVAPCAGPPLLAEITSPKGTLLRLFSTETIPIIQAFLQS